LTHKVNEQYFSIISKIQGGSKSKPLPNYQKIGLNRVNACQWN